MTLLSGATAPALEALLACHILKGLRPADLHRAPSKPGGQHILFEQYWVEAGPAALPDEDTPDEFVLTPSVRHHLSMLARAVLLRKHPILLQVRNPLPRSACLGLLCSACDDAKTFLGLKKPPYFRMCAASLMSLYTTHRI